MTSFAPASPYGMDIASAMLQQNATSGISRNATLSGKDNANDQRIAESAKEFEAVFVSQMLTHMFSGLPTDGPFGGGHAEEVWRSFMVNEYGKAMVEAGGLGIADQVKQHLIGLQEIK